MTSTSAISNLGLCLTAVVIAAPGCYVVRGSHGGGESRVGVLPAVSAESIAVHPGYRIERVASGLRFPTGVAFDAEGRPCIVESGYAYGEKFDTPRLLRVELDGSLTTLASGADNGPWTGVVSDGEQFFVAEGGVLEGGRILRIAADGRIDTLIEDLPSRGDHHTNGPAIGPDGKIYFGIGAATNSGVVGEDSAKFGWLKRFPDFHDVPGEDITLSGQNFETANAFGEGTVETGAYVPYGVPTTKHQVIRGSVRCTGSVLRISQDGGEPELVAWGFRNPFGLAFDDGGQLYVTDNGFDERGSRPIWGAADVLWKVEERRWYGWPDYSAGQPVTRDDFDPPGEAGPKFLLAAHPSTPPAPVAQFACHSSANGLDFSRNREFGFVGDAFVALFGDQVPGTGKLLAPVGFKVVRVELATGAIEDFARNDDERSGPASLLKKSGLERPIAVRFDPAGTTLYVVDFGILRQQGSQSEPQIGTGVLWRIVKEETARATEMRP